MTKPKKLPLFPVLIALQEVRLKRKLSYAALGQRCEMAQSSIVRTLNGDHSPTLKTLYRITNALELEIKFELIPMAKSNDNPSAKP